VNSGPSRSEIAAAAVVLACFVALAVLLLRIDPPGVLEQRAADPLIRAFAGWGGRWLAVGVAGAVCATWIAIEMPARDALARAMSLALRGALAAALVAGALRLVFGASLPAAIPPEESARPGVALGLVAGTLEEALFRLVAMPLALQLAARRFRGRTAVAVAVAATGILFALSHQLAGGDIVWRHFAVRALVPGALFSALFLRPGPAFIVSAHATAHLLIPALFR
jgi:hypothetical protein